MLADPLRRSDVSPRFALCVAPSFRIFSAGFLMRGIQYHSIAIYTLGGHFQYHPVEIVATFECLR